MTYRNKLPKILWGPGLASTLNIGYLLDNVKAGDEPRAGSAFDMSASGVEDAWITGRDYLLTFDVRWIPQTSTTFPLATGWDDGFREFLAWARQKNPLRFYPDATNAFVFVDCYLADPMQGTPDFEMDGTRKLTMTLRVAPFPSPAVYSAGVGGSGWTAGGTTSRTPAALTAPDGITLDLIGDTDAGTQSVFSLVTALTGDGTKAMRFRVVRASAYSPAVVELIDLSAGGAGRIVANLDFTTSTLTVTLTAGQLIYAKSLGDGTWEVLIFSSSVTAAHTNEVVVAPAGGPAGDMAQIAIGELYVWNVPVGLRSFDGY